MAELLPLECGKRWKKLRNGFSFWWFVFGGSFFVVRCSLGILEETSRVVSSRMVDPPLPMRARPPCFTGRVPQTLEETLEPNNL
jgi:hypothetical protein